MTAGRNEDEGRKEGRKMHEGRKMKDGRKTSCVICTTESTLNV